MPSDKFFISETDGIEPLALTVAKTAQVTSESRSKVYELLGDGTYTGLKAGRRTLITYESIKRRFASLPRAVIKRAPPRPPRAVPEAPRRGRKPKPVAPASPEMGKEPRPP
jgi:hypothetical protein